MSGKQSSHASFWGRIKTYLALFVKSIWLFPAICTIVVIILCSLRISGSSIGIFNTVFYGNKADSNLIFGHPQATRSDEYNVGSLMTIAQSKVDYQIINKNVGNGEDVSVLGDLPYRDWSTLFRPHNIGFLVLPFDNAFALKWWLPGYLLVLASYFFVLLILPGRKLLAVLLSSAFLLSPFFQWWYLPDTLGLVAGALFGVIVFIKILHAKRRLHAIAWSVLLTYIATCYIFFFYPPFQIACGIVAFAFLIGYLIHNKQLLKNKTARLNTVFSAGAAVLSVIVVVLFMVQHRGIVEVIQNTAYPGVRVTKSGQANPYYFLSSNISPVLEMGDRYQAYEINTSKSELSNFILITPFLLLPAFYMLYRERNAKRNYLFIAVTAAFLLLVAWSLIPDLSLIGKLTLLDKVPVNRALIGIGMANFILLVLLVALFKKSKVVFSNTQITIYSLLIVIFYLLLDMHWLTKNPGFLGIKTAVFLALPFAAIVALFMKRWYTWAIAGLLAFSFVSVVKVNPLYVGTDVVTKTAVSQAIQSLNKEDPKRWVGDDNYLENFPILNGAQSLSATYYYPQLSLWHEIDPTGDQANTYNRYAHVNFAFDRNPNKEIKPTFYKRGDDLFYVIIEACDPFLRKNNVGYLITGKKFNPGEADCAALKSTINYPNKMIYIYKLSF